jgi:hypothetical protein
MALEKVLLFLKKYYGPKNPYPKILVAQNCIEKDQVI